MKQRPQYIPHVPRERDEELLQWIRWREKGFAMRRIAAIAGTNPGAIVNATNKVRNADRKESGEPQSLSRYW